MGEFQASPPVVKPTKDAYSAMKGGYLFTCTHQTASTTLLAQTSFVATTPTFIIEQSAASRRVVGLEYWLNQEGTAVAGGPVFIRVMIDSVARRASGGTTVTPQNANMESAITSGATVYFNPTASAATATQRVIWAHTAPASLGTMSNLDLEDGLGIGVTGSILIYVWAATTAPTLSFAFRWKEEA